MADSVDKSDKNKTTKEGSPPSSPVVGKPKSPKSPHDPNATPKKSAMKKRVVDEPMTWTQIWQSLVVLGIACAFAGTGLHIFFNPDSIKWLEPYLMDGLISSAGPTSENVIVLDSENFDQVRESRGFLVEFYAPWCTHCQKLAPEFGATADALVGEAQFGAMDCIKNKDLCSEFKVQSFPTLIWFANNTTQSYTGSGTTSALLQFWVQKRTRGPTIAVETQADVKLLRESHPTLVLGFLPQGSPHLLEFTTTAMADDKRPYVLSSDESLAATYCEKTPCAVVLSDYRDEPAVWDWSGETMALVKFVGIEQFPIVFNFKQELAQVIFGGGYLDTTVYLFGGDEAVQKTFTTLAHEQRNSAIFVVVDDDGKETKGGIFASSSPSLQHRLQEYLGVGDIDAPCITIIEKSRTGGRMKKYPLEERLSSADQVRTHYEQYAKGELSQKLKSEEAPLVQTTPVATIVGNNFNDFVGDDNALFLEVYAPWCGHCKKLEPVWNTLAERYDDGTNIVIAKMDGTANEVDQIQVRGFPSLHFFAPHSRTPIVYSGGRNAVELDVFVQEQLKLASSTSTSSSEKDEL
eukprot:m.150450 g.150450  ORF g.150450 m.150450 type:complete len:576 (-) comp30725_c2_seq2:213-1940(-)